MMAAVNPFDWRTVLLAKHAQHVVLIHFPIALFIAAVAFDCLALWTKRRGLQEASYYNLTFAALSTVPAVVTGILAWQFALEGETLKGTLLLHLALGSASTLLIWLVWWIHFRARRRSLALPVSRMFLEALGVAIIGLAAHLGGFLSGINQ